MGVKVQIGKKWVHALSLLGLLLPAACASLNYYDQALRGQAQLLFSRQPLEQVIDDPDTPAELRQQLLTAARLQQFAAQHLHLPGGTNTQYYADLGRPYSVWAVFATPWNSLEPKTWCYPVVGCLSYRGFFRLSPALTLAQQLEDEGLDHHVQGVPAYSTLGWFADPLLNTFIHWPTPALAHLMFHEKAHEQLYVADDTDFNESYAEAVALTGVRRWLAAHPCEADQRYYDQAQTARAGFLRLLPPFRQELETLYSLPLSDGEKRRRKKHILDALVQGYFAEKNVWDREGRYEKWFTLGVNNAKLASVHTYNKWVAALLRLLDNEGGDLAAFHAQAAQLAALPAPTRQARLREIGP